MSSTRKEIISFKVRADIKESLQKLAAQDGRSVSNYIERALDEHIKQATKKAGKSR